MVRKKDISYSLVCIYITQCIENIYKCMESFSLQITNYKLIR